MVVIFGIRHRYEPQGLITTESDAFKRYLKKFDEQETVIEKHQARVKELKAELAKHEKALKDFAETAKAE